jgi:small-conductance mechanosensitive channel
MLESFFTNQYLVAIITVVTFYLASYIVTYLLSLLEKVTSKTKSNLDDKIIQAAKLPIRYLAVLIGFYIAIGKTDLNFSFKNFNIGDVFYILIVLLLSFTASRIVKVFLDWYGEIASEKKHISKTMFIFLSKIISISVYVTATIIVLGHFNVEIAPLIAGLGIFGLAIAFGLKETMANLFAALFLVLDKSINIGDYIQLEDGTKAFIEDISWRSVRIQTIRGNTVIVPNNKFVGQNISSYDYPESPMTTSITLGVSYDSDLEQVEYVAKQVGEAVIQEQGISVVENNPSIRFQVLGESSIDFSIYLKIDKVTDEGRVKHALIKKMIAEFKTKGIDIPYPHRVVVKK